MDQASNFHLISPTAKIAAFARETANIPYAAAVSRLCGGEALVREIYKGNTDIELHKRAYVELRFKATNALIEKSGAHQILELATGIAPRGLGFTEDLGYIYVETDLPGIIDEKREIAHQVLGSNTRSNLHFTAANALNLQELEAATTPFGKAPIAIVCEGFLFYLTRAEKMVLATNIKELLSWFGGAWVTPDVWTKERHAKMLEESTAAKGVAEKRGHRIVDNCFDDERDAEKFFADAGFRTQHFKLTDLAPGVDPASPNPIFDELDRMDEAWVMTV